MSAGYVSYCSGAVGYCCFLNAFSRASVAARGEFQAPDRRKFADGCGFPESRSGTHGVMQW